jgi:hypothetical protein
MPKLRCWQPSITASALLHDGAIQTSIMISDLVTSVASYALQRLRLTLCVRSVADLINGVGPQWQVRLERGCTGNPLYGVVLGTSDTS